MKPNNINPEYLAEVRKIYGKWLRELRESKGWSQQDLAERIGINQTTVSKVEAGKWNFGIDTLTIMAIHLDAFLFMVPKESESDLAKTMRERWGRENEGQ